MTAEWDSFKNHLKMVRKPQNSVLSMGFKSDVIHWFSSNSDSCKVFFEAVSFSCHCPTPLSPTVVNASSATFTTCSICAIPSKQCHRESVKARHNWFFFYLHVHYRKKNRGKSRMLKNFFGKTAESPTKILKQDWFKNYEQT